MQCTSNLDCGAATPICDPQELQCRAGCSSNAQCPNKDRAICDVKNSDCVQCLTNTDCPLTAPVCGKDNRCGNCASNQDCKNPAAPYCFQDTASCVQCSTDKQCPTNAPNCQKNVCIP